MCRDLALLQVSGSAILMLGAWLALHKDSFIALTTYGLESQHIQVSKHPRTEDYVSQSRLRKAA